MLEGCLRPGAETTKKSRRPGSRLACLLQSIRILPFPFLLVVFFTTVCPFVVGELAFPRLASASSLLSPRLDFRVAGSESGFGLGATVRWISDLDSDGKPDLLIGAPAASPDGRADAGRVVWVNGVTGQEIGRFDGPGAGIEAGASVLAPGDLDGDGKGDIVIGAPGTTLPARNRAGALLAISSETGSILWQALGPAPELEIGTALVALEDLDGDGVAEILAGGPGSNETRGHLLLLSGATGRVLKSKPFGNPGDRAGESLTSVGDLDGNGKPEILIGAPASDEGRGVVYVLSRSKTPLYVLRGNAAGERFGSAATGLEDLDGDLVPDLLIGSSGDSETEGRFRVISGATGTVLHTEVGAVAEGFASSLTSFDLDDDGTDEIFVGAPLAVSESTGETTGAVSVYSTPDFLRAATLEGAVPGGRFGEVILDVPMQGSGLLVTSPGASPLCRLGAGVVESYRLELEKPVLFHLTADSFNPLGSAVSRGGDLNGDGLPELLVGVPLEDPEQQRNAGSVFVFSGKDGAPLRRLDSQTPDDLYGTVVADLGDLDGDTVHEFVIGAPGLALGDRPGYLEVRSGADGSVLYRVDGDEPGDRFGAAIGTRLDYDGDGFRDLLVGSPGRDAGGLLDVGRVEIFSGRDGVSLGGVDGAAAKHQFGRSVAWIEDVDGDQTPDLLVGAPFASPGGRLQSGLVTLFSGAALTNIRTYTGENYFDHLGTSVASIDDLDGDGIPEILLGAPESNPKGRADAGSVFLHAGDGSGLLFRFDGEFRGDRAGSSIAAVDDLDGDELPELLVGQGGATVGGLVGAGKVSLLSGADGEVILEFEGDDRGLAMGDAVATAGDVDGDGFPELIAGGSGLGQTGNGGSFVVLNPVVPRSIGVRTGNVNQGVGARVDVLKVNGGSGSKTRREVRVGVGEPVEVTLAKAPANLDAGLPHSYALYLWRGEPGDETVTALPHGMGALAFPSPLTGGASQPESVINTFLSASCPGVPPATDGTTQAMSFPAGFEDGDVFTIQAILADAGSSSPEKLSVSNAVVLIVE